MNSPKIFYKTYDLFVEETSHGIQSIYASKFFEEIGN